MKIELSESELYNIQEIYFTPTDLNMIQHEFWMVTQKTKDTSEVNIYFLDTCKTSDQIGGAVENAKNLQKFFPKDQMEYILNCFKLSLLFVKED